MDPFEQGYFLFLKTAGLGDDLRNEYRAFKGEETDRNMAIHAAGLGLGAAHAPMTADQLLGLQRMSELDDVPMSGMERLKDFYTGKRVPRVAVENFDEAFHGGGVSKGMMDDMAGLVEDGAGRGGRTLRRALKDLPTNVMRRPGTAALGLLGAAATGQAAYGLGKGIYERNFKEPDYTPALMAAGGLGALGAGAAGLRHAHQQGMLPRVNLDIQMPEEDR